MTALWAQEAAERFWRACGGEPADLPRDPRQVLSWGLPLAVVDLPGLSVATVCSWLERRGLAIAPAMADRRVRGCLVVWRAKGIVFLDVADPPDERRFSLAHEVAHYLVDYARPREEAARRVGPGVLAVLEGSRRPTRAERIDAALAGVSLRPYVHLMERTEDGHPVGAYITEAERRADSLAVELLAPIEAVRERLGGSASTEEAERILRSPFGLPPGVARAVARRLAPPAPRGARLARQLLGLEG